MTPRSVVLIEGPVVEPVSLLEAKSQLRMTADQTDDDGHILGLIATGRRLIERRMGVALVAQQYRATWDHAHACVQMPNPPLLDGEDYPIVVTADDEDVDADDYTIDTDSMPGLIEFSRIPSGRLKITYWAGVLPSVRVAPQIRSALLILVDHLYANRGAEQSDMPIAIDVLLASESHSGAY